MCILKTVFKLSSHASCMWQNLYFAWSLLSDEPSCERTKWTLMIVASRPQLGGRGCHLSERWPPWRICLFKTWTTLRSTDPQPGKSTQPAFYSWLAPVLPVADCLQGKDHFCVQLQRILFATVEMC